MDPHTVKAVQKEGKGKEVRASNISFVIRNLHKTRLFLDSSKWTEYSDRDRIETEISYGRDFIELRSD